MNNIKPYIKYKASGIEWLGEIQEYWQENKLKIIGILYSGLTGKRNI
ncbi:MAG: hypothetical protein RBR87_05875 [Bacteroidales bacterium]|jgi:hypothetical protein|nr:hypothetical protein [Bacteroidales bacterium]